MSTGPLDLGAIKGSVELDISNFERRYGDVDRQLTALAQRQVKDVTVGADTDQATRSLQDVDQLTQRLDGSTAATSVTADVAKAESAVNGVEGMLEGLARREFDPRVDADITAAQRSISDVELDLEVLRRMDVTPRVTADISKAESKLSRAESRLQALEGLRAEMSVDADISPAENALGRLGDEGEAAGDDAGEGMSKGILAGLAAIPVAGGVLLIGVAIAKGLMDGILDGLQQEATRDMFSARTGLDEATSEKFGRAAGDAYGSAWGNSVEENLDTARLALQGGLIDADATTDEVEKVIASLTGVSDILGEDIPRLSRAVGTMMKTGMAPDAQAALDIIVAGTQAGANVSEDLLDTLTEYPAVFEKLGIDGEMSVGLISQAMQNGARDTDYAADALKEFQIRATDGSEASAEAFQGLGFDAEEMTAKIAKGGDDAATGLGMVLDGLRNMTDPVERNQVAVGLFGTKAEDLGDALFAMDTSSAVQELEKVGDVAGRSESALSTMADNGASSVESAKRSIELSAAGLQGVLAQMFEAPLSELATYVSTNRAGVLEHFEAIGIAAFDMAELGVQGAATLVEAYGKIPGSLEPVISGMIATLGSIQAISNSVPGIPDVDFSGSIETLQGLRGGLDDAATGSEQAAAAMRDKLLDQGLYPLRDAFEKGIDTQILSAQVHDATTAMASSISSVGESVEDLNNIKLFEDGSFRVANADARALDEQLTNAVGSMQDVQTAAVGAGDSQASLNKKWKLGRDALVDQLTAMGFTKQEANLLAEAYGAIPSKVETSASLKTAPALAHLDDLIVTVDKSSGTIRINGDKANGDQTLAKLIGNVNKADGTVTINGNRVPANLTLEQYLGKINASDGTVTVKGDDRPGRYVLKDYKGAINASDGTVGLLGDDAKGRLELRDFLRKINDSDGTTTILGQDRPARSTLFDYQRLVNAADGTVDVLGDDDRGRKELRDFVHGVDTSDGTVDVKASTAKASATMRQFFKDQSGKTIGVTYGFNSAGGLADGGLMDSGRLAFADGGMSDSGQVVPRQSMMGGPQYGKKNILWGEDPTGWEAYISGKPGQETRNLDILGITAGKMGKALVDIEEYANGGLRNLPTMLDVDADMAGVASALAGLAGGGGGPDYTGANGRWWQTIVGDLQSAGFNPNIMSTYRPNTRGTATGLSQSRHNIYPGLAADLYPNAAEADWLWGRRNQYRETYLSDGRAWLLGQDRRNYPGAATAIGRHTGAGRGAVPHNHVAYEDGGIIDALSNPKAADTGQVALDPGWNAVYNGLGRLENLVEGPAAPPQVVQQAAPTVDFSRLEAQIGALAQAVAARPVVVRSPVTIGRRAAQEIVTVGATEQRRNPMGARA